MGKNTKNITLSLTLQNIERIEEIAKKRHEMEKSSFVNISASVNVLIRLGHQTFHLLNPDPSPHTDSDLSKKIKDLATDITHASGGSGTESDD